jgi:hydroxypyruvate isomerase
MFRLCADLAFLFTELPFLDRFEVAAKAGAEEMAYVAVYLASDESDYMTGSCIQPDGGFTL